MGTQGNPTMTRTTPSGGLADLLKRRRNELGMSYKDTGAAAGIDQSLVWQIERGISANPKILVLAALASALELSFHDVCDAALVDAATLTNATASRRRVHGLRQDDEDGAA